MGLSVTRSEKDIVEEAENYIARFGRDFYQNVNLFYNEERGSYPYAATFFMFLCGGHEAALRYA